MLNHSSEYAVIDGKNNVASDKRAIAKSFGGAAGSYNSVTGLQRNIGDALLELLKEYRSVSTDEHVLDIGCGTGYLVSQLRRDVGDFYALDIAQGMLQVAKQTGNEQNRSAQELGNSKVHYICADAEAIPLKASTVDIVVSNFAIQWCPNKSLLFEEVARVLRPGGVFVFSMPGTDTLRELKASWQKADPNHSHVNQFCGVQEIERDIINSSLVIETLKVRQHVKHYDKLQYLTCELKAMGAHNVTDGRAKQLTGKGTIKRLVAAYDEFRNERGLLPATWNVIYGVLIKSNQRSE